MESTAPSTLLTCTQCGGELHPDEGQLFVTCPFCSATVYVDKTQVVFHWSLRPTLNEQQAGAALARWMSGSQTVKDLDKKARVISCTFVYFPLWYFKRSQDLSNQTAQTSAKPVIQLQPGAATSITELRKLVLPAGDLVAYDPAIEAQCVTPSVPRETALGWGGKINPGQSEQVESALVHVPIYVFKYTFNGQTYTAVVEGATGSVLANLFPSKPEAPYLLAGGLTAAVYLILALFPVFGRMAGGADAAAGAFGVAFIIGLVAAPFLFAFALWVASKV